MLNTLSDSYFLQYHIYGKTLSLLKSFPFYTQFCSYPLLPNVYQANINTTCQLSADNKNVGELQRKHLHIFWRYQDSEICYCSLLKI